MRSPPARHTASWAVFIVLLLFAACFVAGTAAELPLAVASHFDAAGRPTAFMSRGGYVRFVCGFSLALPLAVVALFMTVYSRATVLKLPNRDYWLAPQRLQQTRGEPPAAGASGQSRPGRRARGVFHRRGGVGGRTDVRLSSSRRPIAIWAAPPSEFNFNNSATA